MASRSARRAADRRRPVDRRHPAGTLGTGRVTPKGTTPADRRPASSSRYTPPVPREQKVSPMWVPILMFTLLGVGAALIVLNYMDLLPGPDPSNWYLLTGLGLITGGFATATRYH